KCHYERGLVPRDQNPTLAEFVVIFRSEFDKHAIALGYNKVVPKFSCVRLSSWHLIIYPTADIHVFGKMKDCAGRKRNYQTNLFAWFGIITMKFERNVFVRGYRH